MATKRRKVWVNEYACDRALGELAWSTATRALSAIGSDGVAVPFVERLPGDVVLSREDVALLRNTLGLLEKIAERHLGQVAPVSVMPLLRGRR